MPRSTASIRPLFACLACGLLTTGAIRAQDSTPAPSATPTPAPSSAPAATPAPAAPRQLDRVEIRGAQQSDTEQRRRSTAAKIIVGREEIERYGDETVGELLRRLPGVTLQGPPGRGGRIAMRGMGNYTQILLDGQRVPPGFSLDSLNPEQIERIEILRAPTAETGARAIAGTINIITREGFVKRLNDLVVGSGYENGRLQPGLSWTRNDSVERLIYNLSASVNRNDRDSDGVTTTTTENAATGAPVAAQRETYHDEDRRTTVTASGRLQYRLDNGMLVLAPFALNSRWEGERVSQLSQTLGTDPPLYDRSAATREGSFTLARMNAQWRHRLASGARLEARATLGEGRSDNESRRREFDAAGNELRVLDSRSKVSNQSGDIGAKLSFELGQGHSLVTGAEAEFGRRRDNAQTLQNGAPLLTDFGDNLEARSTRLALYAQDEWNPSERWSAHAGLRWEGISTRGDGTDAADARNRSSVFSPLLHAVWKPHAKSQDQIRISLTRSYRSPALNDLIARPSVSPRYPVGGPNTPTSPDRAGNPELTPELATGIDLAAERYLPAGGLFSANLFYRRITDLMRTLTTLETVSWSPVPRWVARPQNIGNASTAGIELEAKLRLTELVKDAPPIDLRANASFYRSRVDSVPGPDNRLDQQAHATLNLGADYRLRGTPFTFGGNINLTPAYDTRLSETQWSKQGRKQVLDAYAQWSVNPALRLRLSVSNALPIDYTTGNTVLTDGGLRETSLNDARSYVSWRLRAEFKL
jgi:iron complex outermembrane receptor protein